MTISVLRFCHYFPIFHFVSKRDSLKNWIAISKAKNYFEVLILIYIRWTKVVQNIFDWKRVLLWAILFEPTNPNSTTTTTRPKHQKGRLHCQISPTRDGISWPTLSSMLGFCLAWLPAGPVHAVAVAVTSCVQVLSYVWKAGFHCSHHFFWLLQPFCLSSSMIPKSWEEVCDIDIFLRAANSPVVLFSEPWLVMGLCWCTVKRSFSAEDWETD